MCLPGATVKRSLTIVPTTSPQFNDFQNPPLTLPSLLHPGCSAYGFLKSGAKLDANDIQEEREIAIFLATQNSLTTKLRDTLEAIERYEEVLAEIVNECATFYENGYYVLPEEKHMLLKVREWGGGAGNRRPRFLPVSASPRLMPKQIMAFSIFLMDGTKSKANIYKNKKINLTRFDKLFKV